MTVQAFPFASLPAVSRDELDAARRLRDAERSFTTSARVASALTELCGETVAIAVRRAKPRDGLRVPTDTVGILFGAAEADGLTRAVLVEVESALAGALVTRALRQRAPRVSHASRAPSPEIAGSLAALLHATMRRAHAGAPLRVIAAGPADALARDFVAVHPRAVTAWLTVEIANEGFDARVSIPFLELRAPHEGRQPIAIATMTDVAIGLPLVVATCVSGRSELAALRPGDVFVAPGCTLRTEGTEGRRLVGPVTVLPAASERGLSADLAEGQRLVLRTERVASHPWDSSRWTTEKQPMTGEANATLEVLEDVPVVVRIELGTVEMTLGEWSALGPGDVVALGRKLGDPAILRVGGVEVARGELVQVDGEYGVRVLGRAGET